LSRLHKVGQPVVFRKLQRTDHRPNYALLLNGRARLHAQSALPSACSVFAVSAVERVQI
jgi:hypothetical protein